MNYTRMLSCLTILSIVTTSTMKHDFSKFNDLWISSNYGTAFKAPLFYQLYSGDYASPDLEPETTKTFDVTVCFSGLEITYFKNKIDYFIVSRREKEA